MPRCREGDKNFQQALVRRKCSPNAPPPLPSPCRTLTHQLLIAPPHLNHSHNEAVEVDSHPEWCRQRRLYNILNSLDFFKTGHARHALRHWRQAARRLRVSAAAAALRERALFCSGVPVLTVLRMLHGTAECISSCEAPAMWAKRAEGGWVLHSHVAVTVGCCAGTWRCTPAV